MSQEHKLSASEEEYLEAIYTRQEGGAQAATTGDLAACLGVKDASVTEMLKKLSEKELVNYTPYHGATLTEAGLKIATKVKRKHRLLERFLVDICGIGKRESHEQACEIEHVISDKAIDNLSTQLGNPATCPGGSAIPDGEKGDETEISRARNDKPAVLTRPHPGTSRESAAEDLERSHCHRDEGHTNRAWQGRRRVSSREPGRRERKRNTRESEKGARSRYPRLTRIAT
jgi:Mn-dependent DtxR family transcriptional regulator